MNSLRARFKKGIVAEFMKPRRPSRKVIIFCDGLPTVPAKRTLLEFFCKKGYWVFHPRYRGSWESDGEFLARSPHEDVLDIVDELPKGFTSIWDGMKYKLEPKKIFVIGSSFGGTAALLASRDPRVTKVVCISPVVDWTAPSKAEPLDWFYQVVKESFGEAYRLTKKNWNKLKGGKFFNPLYQAEGFDPNKIFFIHAKNDEVVNFSSAQKFLRRVKCQSMILPRGGHLSSRVVLQKRVYRRLKKFFK